MPDVDKIQEHRQRSCTNCRRLKIRCDRQRRCCGACRSAERSCSYPPGRGRAPKRSRARETSSSGSSPLSERVSQLEAILHNLRAAQDLAGSNLKSSSRERLILDQEHSYYVNHDLWAALTDEVEDIRSLLMKPLTRHRVHHNTASNIGMILWGRTNPSNLVPALPMPSALAESLFEIFALNVAPMVPIFHMPTLVVLHDAAVFSRLTDRSFEALRAVIYYSAVVSLTIEQCIDILAIPQDEALVLFRSGAEQALSCEDLLNTKSLVVLQAAVLFLSALGDQENSQKVWSLTSLVYHLARSMGLHRDGTVFGLDPFDTELRRRIWWHICVLDARSAGYYHHEPIVDDSSFDTHPPLHIDDCDLSQGMVDKPEEHWGKSTDSTFAVVRCEAIKYGWKLRQSKTRVPAIAAKQMSSPVQASEQMVYELQHHLSTTFLQNVDADTSYGVVICNAMRMIVARLLLGVHSAHEIAMGAHPSRRPIPQDHSVRDTQFDLALEIIEASLLLLTSKHTIGWAWYAKTHFHWGALILALNELCSRRPNGTRRDRAWAAVTLVEREMKIHANASKGGLYWNVSKLLAKAQCTLL